MGQGQITTHEGVVVTGGPWPGAEMKSKSSDRGAAASCCAGTAKDATNDAPREAAAPPKRSCCSGKSADAKDEPGTPTDAIKKETTPGATTNDDTTPPPPHTHASPRVHCVPNPSGTGCTCLCESDVCLLRVRRTLSTSPERERDGSDGRPQIPSLHLTLSASQAISASCACSSTCPTCKFHPSSSAFNASLLISLSLQIYARAVRILRDGFAEDGNGLEIKIGGYRPRKENAKKIALLAMRLELTDLERGMAKVWSVAVGQGIEVEPSVGGSEEEAAAQKRLQSVMDHNGGTGGGGGDSLAGALQTAPRDARSNAATKPERDRRLAPIDRIVIRKLREQLKEMIVRVGALENS